MLLNLRKHGSSESPEYRAEIRTFGQFKDYLARITDIPRDRILVKLGEPPVAVHYHDDTLLSNTAIHDQANVTVGWRSDMPAAAQTAAPTAASAATPVATPAVCSGGFWGGGWFGRSCKDPHVQVGDGCLVRRSVPRDDSCLFSSLAACLDRQGMTPQQLRALVVSAISASPSEFNEAVLGQPVREYCEWLSKPSSWGGGIEMAIISQAFHVEICSVDIHTLRTDRFGEGRYRRRVFILYTGSHYDYVAFASNPGDPREFDQTEFAVDAPDANSIFSAAVALAAKVQ
ncbi:ubiquitin-specific protease otu1 [Coemansia helicoidea]|uniref:Ubiquitin-specific protease otu1 n=1 Tax=Coemansia helicoidea TaxID=1286919 RepID=A0ACC1L1Q8_9FUNG|nr:ubiquitin-specific protease otu1 [Coemansia helicoidea]